MRHVLVTGGNGFIGRWTVRLLAERGYEVVVLDTRYREPAAGELLLGDIRDATAVTEAVAHVDGVIHLAGVLGTQETIRNPRPAAETNILGGLNVFEACAQYGVPLVNIAVGNWWMDNTYSITKNTMERFARMFVVDRGAHVSIVRALNAYGPGQSMSAPYGPSKVRKIMPSFICRALTGEPIEVYGDGTQVMDMIHVSDVARALVGALETDHPVDIEAGTGRATTVNDIAELVVAEVGGSIRHLPMRPGEAERSVVLGDPLTMRAVGIEPDSLTRLEAALPATVDYFRTALA